VGSLSLSKEKKMGSTTLTRRTVLRTAALATTALATPFVRSARAVGTVVPKGKMVLAWHTNISALARPAAARRHGDSGQFPDGATGRAIWRSPGRILIYIATASSAWLNTRCIAAKL
jgi:hypothetical protein